MGGGVTGLPVCTKNDQPNCCYDGKKFYGIPHCSWTRLGPGESVSITTAER